MKKLLLIDNYDSFTFNLAQLLEECGTDRITIIKNDRLALPLLENFDALILSPGPGVPDEAGQCKSLIKMYAGKIPILGICLGHQAIAEVYGAKLINLQEVRHGYAVNISYEKDDPLFSNIPFPFRAGLYHSWAVDDSGFPEELQIIARSEEGVIMGIRHRSMPLWGFQFHPESFITENGSQLIKNWLYLNEILVL